MSEWQPTFEGMDLGTLAESPSGKSGIAESALATLQALDAQGLLRPQDALTCQLVLELSQALGRGLGYGKVTVAVSQLTRQLLDALDKLPKPAGADDSLGQAWLDFQKAIAGAEQ